MLDRLQEPMTLVELAPCTTRDVIVGVEARDEKVRPEMNS